MPEPATKRLNLEPNIKNYRRCQLDRTLKPSRDPPHHLAPHNQRSSYSDSNAEEGAPPHRSHPARLRTVKRRPSRRTRKDRRRGRRRRSRRRELEEQLAQSVSLVNGRRQARKSRTLSTTWTTPFPTTMSLCTTFESPLTRIVPSGFALMRRSTPATVRNITPSTSRGE